MLEFIKSLHSAEGIGQIIQWGGLFALIGIIFAETGLLVGFFLPGDSLLIAAGMFANPGMKQHIEGLDIVQLNILLFIAAVVGDQVGFYLGTKISDRIWERPDGRFYKRKYMEEAHDFYMRHGGLAIVGARFLPIMRTFVPFAAGVAKMPYKNFVFWNILGGFVWVTSLLWAGVLPRGHQAGQQRRQGARGGRAGLVPAAGLRRVEALDAGATCREDIPRRQARRGRRVTNCIAIYPNAT
jgi:membrane-associated protein